MNNSSKNNNNENIIIFGVMRQIIGNVFNPQNELCGSIAFSSLGSIEESLAISSLINEEIQADPKHHMQGERFIPIQKIGGVWYEIRGGENLPHRMNSLGEDEFFVSGGWSVETPPTPTSPILELGDMRQVGLFSWEYCLVTDQTIIKMIFEDLVIKDSSNTPRASLFVLSKDGAWQQVWGSYQVAPQVLSYAELLWIIGDSPIPPSQEQESEEESEEEKYFSFLRGKTELKNNEAEAAFNNFMDAVNAGDVETLKEIADEAFEPLVYKIIPKDDDKEALI